MEVHDDPLPEPEFAACLERLPQACVELVLEHDGRALLCRRTNKPAAGEWFWPGSRLYKGEPVEDGARRVGREELGLEVTLTGLLGVYDHFWEASGVPGASSRHTVNAVFRARPAEDPVEVTLDDQHDASRFVEGPEPGLHPYVLRYLEDAGYGAVD